MTPSLLARLSAIALEKYPVKILVCPHGNVDTNLFKREAFIKGGIAGMDLVQKSYEKGNINDPAEQYYTIGYLAPVFPESDKNLEL